MAYRITKRASPRRCIDISEEWKLRYWSDVLGVSGQVLRRAVDKVGARAEDVERELYTAIKG